MSRPVASSVRATAHKIATSRPVSDEDEDAAGTALRTPRARADSPPAPELARAAEWGPLPAPALVVPRVPDAGVPPVVELLVAGPLDAPELIAADPDRLPASATAP